MSEDNSLNLLYKYESEKEIARVNRSNNAISASTNIVSGFFSYLDVKNQRRYELEKAAKMIQVASLQLEKERDQIKERLCNRKFNFEVAINEIQNIQKSINDTFDILKITMSRKDLNKGEVEICKCMLQQIMELRKESKDVLSAFFNI